MQIWPIGPGTYGTQQPAGSRVRAISMYYMAQMLASVQAWATSTLLTWLSGLPNRVRLLHHHSANTSHSRIYTGPGDSTRLRSCRALDQGGYANEDAHSQVGMQFTLCRAQRLCEVQMLAMHRCVYAPGR